MPDSTPTIHQRMISVLTDMPAIGKNQKNTQQGFMFRGHDDVLNALNPLLAKHGVFVLPDVIERITSQRTTKSGGVMFEVSLHVTYTFHGAGGDCVAASTWGEGTDSGDKATSKAMTMAFKSALNQAFAISNAETDDPDRHTLEESVISGGAAAGTTASAPKKGTPPASSVADAPSPFQQPQPKEPDAEALALVDRALELCNKLGVDGTKTLADGAKRYTQPAAYKRWLKSQIVILEGNVEQMGVKS